MFITTTLNAIDAIGEIVHDLVQEHLWTIAMVACPGSIVGAIFFGFVNA